MSNLETELSHLQEVTEVHKRRVNDVMKSMLQDLGEIGVALGNKEQVGNLFVVYVFIFC